MKTIALGTNKEKRDALENNVKYYLKELGWECDKSVREKGSETDIVAYHDFLPNPLYIECKAVINPIGAPEIDKFRSQFQRLNEFVQFGWFISLSGYKNGVESSFRGIPNLKLFDGKSYYQFLKNNGLCVGYEKILNDYKITRKEIISLYLWFKEQKMYWIARLPNNEFVFESATQDRIDKEDYNYFIHFFNDFKIEDENRIVKINEWNVIKTFFDSKPHTIEETTKNLNCFQTSANFYVNKLLNENILVNLDQRFIINDSFNSVEKIIQKVSKIKKSNIFPIIEMKTSAVYEFGKSSFYKSKIKRYVNKIIKKFDVSKTTPEEKEILIKILKISPFSICYCFGEFDRIWEKGPFKAKILIQKLLLLVFRDCIDGKFDLFQEIDDFNKLILFNPSIEIIYALKGQKYLKLNGFPTSVAIFKLEKNQGIILRGEPMKAADDILLCNMGGLLLECEQYNSAIECYNLNIAQYDGTIGSLISVVNLMLCYLRKNQPEEAIKIYDKYKDKIINNKDKNLKSLNKSVDIPKEFKNVRKSFEANYSRAKTMIKNRK